MTPKLLDVYQKEYERRKQDEVDMMDYSAWLNGKYIKSAIAVFINKQNEYPAKPFHELNETDRNQDVSPDKQAAINFGNWAMAFNLARGKDGEVSGR